MSLHQSLRQIIAAAIEIEDPHKTFDGSPYFEYFCRCCSEKLTLKEERWATIPYGRDFENSGLINRTREEDLLFAIGHKDDCAIKIAVEACLEYETFNEEMAFEPPAAPKIDQYPKHTAPILVHFLAEIGERGFYVTKYNSWKGAYEDVDGGGTEVINEYLKRMKIEDNPRNYPRAFARGVDQERLEVIDCT